MTSESDDDEFDLGRTKRSSSSGEARRFKKMHENFAYYNYLEKESLRLDRLCDFFEHKLPNFIETTQSQRLIEIQQRKNEELLSLLLDQLVKEDSNLQGHLAHLFDRSW